MVQENTGAPEDGRVVRRLSFMDRRLVLEAVEAYGRRPQQQRSGRAEADGMGGSYRSMMKIARLRDVLDADGVLSYYEAMEDTLTERREKWTREVDAYAKASNDGAPRPPRRAPQLSPEELKGQEANYRLSPRDDVYIQDALKEMDWSRFPAEDVVRVCEKFGIRGDEN